MHQFRSNTLNQIMLIKPYYFEDIDTWAFDDWDAELMHEPFVEGIPEMIDDFVKDIPNAKKDLNFYFLDRHSQAIKEFWKNYDQNLTGVGIEILLMGLRVGFVLRCLGTLRMHLTEFTSRLKN